MSGPYGGQDQGPREAPQPASEELAPAEPTSAEPTPAEPTPALPSADAPPAGSAGGGGWQTPDTASFGVPIAAGPATGVTYADLIPRIVAYIIDALILGFGFALVWSVLFTALFITGGFGGVFIGLIIGTVGLLIASAIYFIFTWTKWRASPGQRILSLETVNAGDGATIHQDMAIRRWLFLYGPGAISSTLAYAGGGAIGILANLISFLILGYYIWLLYTAAQDPKRQGFHDKQANTVVVKRSA